MFTVKFYTDKKGRQPIQEVLNELRDKAITNKDARIQYEKILVYIRALRTYGTRLGEPKVKHIRDSLWELRPLKHRVFFFHWQGNQLVFLHHFVKKTQKTPRKEIGQALKNMADFLERNP
jgi:Phage-related protein